MVAQYRSLDSCTRGDTRRDLERMQAAASVIPQDHRIERVVRQEAKDAPNRYEESAEDFLEQRKIRVSLGLLVSDMEVASGCSPGRPGSAKGR